MKKENELTEREVHKEIQKIEHSLNIYNEAGCGNYSWIPYKNSDKRALRRLRRIQYRNKWY